jgi:hypothetical protein
MPVVNILFFAGLALAAGAVWEIFQYLSCAEEEALSRFRELEEEKREIAYRTSITTSSRITRDYLTPEIRPVTIKLRKTSYNASVKTAKKNNRTVA